MRIAVIAATYNRPDALLAVLDGYAAQTDTNFEVIVADDGSKDDTRRLVRNRGVACTQAEYVISTDGDCIPGRDFIAAHRLLAERGRYVGGNRILLSEAFTTKVLQERLPIHEWTIRQWLQARLRGDVNRLLPLLKRSPRAAFRNADPARWEGVKGCNIGMWREDLVRINGLDESYEGWGMEDSDLVIRLMHAGVRHKSGRFLAPVFHLWHRENDRSKLERNRQQLAELMHSARFRAERGIDQYLTAT
jgi:GT2 family glycosyltransferase